MTSAPASFRKYYIVVSYISIKEMVTEQIIKKREYAKEYYLKNKEKYKERERKTKAMNKAWNKLPEKEKFNDMWSLAQKILKQIGEEDGNN